MVYNSPYLENEHGVPSSFFVVVVFVFLTKADLNLTAWQAVKKICIWERVGRERP